MPKYNGYEYDYKCQSGWTIEAILGPNTLTRHYFADDNPLTQEVRKELLKKESHMDILRMAEEIIWIWMYKSEQWTESPDLQDFFSILIYDHVVKNGLPSTAKFWALARTYEYPVDDRPMRTLRREMYDELIHILNESERRYEKEEKEKEDKKEREEQEEKAKKVQVKIEVIDLTSDLDSDPDSDEMVLPPPPKKPRQTYDDLIDELGKHDGFHQFLKACDAEAKATNAISRNRKPKH